MLKTFHWKPPENLTIKLRSDIYCQVTTKSKAFVSTSFLCFLYPCLADAIKAEPDPVPKVFNFFALTAYQTSYLYKRSNLCPKLTYGRVKKITEDSGEYNRFQRFSSKSHLANHSPTCPESNAHHHIMCIQVAQANTTQISYWLYFTRF